jgi:hypothetical protein
MHAAETEAMLHEGNLDVPCTVVLESCYTYMGMLRSGAHILVHFGQGEDPGRRWICCVLPTAVLSDTPDGDNPNGEERSRQIRSNGPW